MTQITWVFKVLLSLSEMPLAAANKDKPFLERFKKNWQEERADGLSCLLCPFSAHHPRTNERYHSLQCPYIDSSEHVCP